MKLRELLMNEMSMPNIKNEEQAVDIIRQAYQSAVVKKQPQGDLLGPLQAALKFLQGTTAPEKYAGEVKKGVAAVKAMKKYGASKGTAQARFTTAK